MFGLAKVEFSPDAGKSWREATITARAEPGKEAWAIWEGQFEMPEGGAVTLRSRMTDGTGRLQIESFSLPQPDGSSGWHSIEVKAA